MKTLGLYEYNGLDTDSKASLVWEKGVFIMNRFEGDFKINLYSLFDFFVEVRYDSKNNSIEKFRAFKTLEALEPYLDRIDLNWKL